MKTRKQGGQSGSLEGVTFELSFEGWVLIRACMKRKGKGILVSERVSKDVEVERGIWEKKTGRGKKVEMKEHISRWRLKVEGSHPGSQVKQRESQKSAVARGRFHSTTPSDELCWGRTLLLPAPVV